MADAAIPREPLDIRDLSQTMYGNIRAISGGMMKSERRDHTLSPTALVGAAVERLLETDQTRFNDRPHLIAAAALAMRRILVEHARTRGAVKRGGGRRKVSWDDLVNAVSTQEDPLLIISLDEAIEKLNAENPRYGSILEMRVFGAMTQPETARVLGVSLATIEKDWAYVKARTLSLLGGDDGQNVSRG